MMAWRHKIILYTEYQLVIHQSWYLGESSVVKDELKDERIITPPSQIKEGLIREDSFTYYAKESDFILTICIIEVERTRVLK